jgi:hypothetical protein
VLGGSCLLSWLSRQDSNWDLQNYHLYNPWALIEGRLRTDLFAVGEQSYLNPLLDVPYFLLATRWLAHSPRLLAGLAGLPWGILALVSFAVARVVARACGAGVAAAAAAAAIGLTGSTIAAEIGTTFGDIPAAVLVLASLLTLLHGQGRPRWGWQALVAGALAGAAAGLKLTQLVLLPALPLAVAAAGGGFRRIGRGMVLFGAGAFAAFLLVAGWWGLHVAAVFGNPTFPYLNDLFRSAWARPLSHQDLTHVPASVWRAVFLPFDLLGKRTFVVSETAFRDPRLLLAWLGTVAAAAASLVPARRRAADPPALRLLIAWLIATYALWVWKFGIIRYAIAIEALSGLPVLIALRLWLPGLRCGQLAGAVLAVLTLGVATTNYAGWGRLKRYGTTVFEIAPITLPDATVVVLAGKPLGFVLPFIRGRELSFIGLADVERGTRLERELAGRIANAPRLAVLLNRPAAEFAPWLSTFGLAIRPGTCRPVPNGLVPDIAICEGSATASDTKDHTLAPPALPALRRGEG